MLLPFAPGCGAVELRHSERPRRRVMSRESIRHKIKMVFYILLSFAAMC